MRGTVGPLFDSVWRWLSEAKVVESRRIRPDLMTWRRGSAQMAARVNGDMNNLSIYSVLLSDVPPNQALLHYLLHYNSLQRIESFGLLERGDRWYVLLKYTLGLELLSQDAFQSHVFYMQERADELDTDMVKRFGGMLHFEDWKKLDQKSVDDMIGSLFG